MQHRPACEHVLAGEVFIRVYYLQYQLCKSNADILPEVSCFEGYSYSYIACRKRYRFPFYTLTSLLTQRTSTTCFIPFHGVASKEVNTGMLLV